MLPIQKQPGPAVIVTSDALQLVNSSAPKPQPETPAPAKPAPKPQAETPAPAAPGPKAPAQRPAETAKQRPGLYANHKPQRLTAEDEAEARFVKGAHFADSDEDDDAND